MIEDCRTMDSNPLQPIPPTAPSLLYHYTSHEAFKSIIENGVIRAGHYRDLKNDVSEVNFGTKELRKAVEVHVTDECDAEYKAFLLEGIDQYFLGDLAIYIVCFTSTVDSSHHWREYTPPSQQGIAIGFDSNQVYKGFLTDIGKGLGHEVPESIQGKPEYRPIHCRYFEQFDMAALIAKRFFGHQSYPAIFRSPHVRQGIGQQILLSTLSISIYQTIVSIKQREFFKDMEVRLFHLGHQERRRFIDINFNPINAVREVWIGPGSEQELCRQTVQRLIDEGRLKCEIRFSNIPCNAT